MRAYEPIGDTEPEEGRLHLASEQIPELTHLAAPHMATLQEELVKAGSSEDALRICEEVGTNLWRSAVHRVQAASIKDDRPLYWTRLRLLQQLRHQPLAFANDNADANDKNKAKDKAKDKAKELRHHLLSCLDNASRGRTSARFTQMDAKHILISGFDPFGFNTLPDETGKLQGEVAVTNPSGAAALELSNTILTNGTTRAEIQSVIFPVRYADFDLGCVESFFAPYIQASEGDAETKIDMKVDMIVTISRGRSEFDFERFAGRNRTAVRADNANVSIWSHNATPATPHLNNLPLEGPEFLESSLPVGAMLTVQSPYLVNYNALVKVFNDRSEEEELTVGQFHELAGKRSAQGSGGSFLSNEISYRTLLLRDRLHSSLPIGHLHTPKPDQLRPGEEKVDVAANQAQIIEQIKQILIASLTVL